MSHFATGRVVPDILKGLSCFHLRGEAVGLFDPEDKDTVLQPASHGITPLKTEYLAIKGFRYGTVFPLTVYFGFNNQPE